MYLFFNSNGQLLEKLEHGPAPRAGSTDFEIFAFFDGVDINSNYTTASLTLFKPDLDNTYYPALLMERKTVIFHKGEDENTVHFADGGVYKGFYFNFSDFTNTQTIEVLFDTVGVWNATIRLFGQNNRIYSQGQFGFLVASGIESEDGETLELETILNNIYLAIAAKMNIDSTFFLRVVSNFPAIGETFDSSIYNINDILFNKADKGFYKLNSLTVTSTNPELLDIKLSGITLPSENTINLLNGKSVTTKEYVNSEVLASFTYNSTTGILKFFNKNGQQIGQDLLIPPEFYHHTHDASDITSGILSPERGGTGQGTLKGAGESIIESLDAKTDEEEFGGEGDYCVGKLGDKILKIPISSLKNYILSGLKTVAFTGNFSDLNNKPTTLSGYGITNAYTKEEVNYRISAEDYLFIN